MAKLRCNCLNICINTKESELKELNGQAFLFDASKDVFFKGKIYEVHLAVGGIQKELEILMRERQVEDWTVYKCLGCDTEPFALHSIKREDRVLVGEIIQSDPMKISAQLRSKDRSPAFKIILEPATEEEENSVNGFSSDSITTAGMRVQDHVKRFLKSEEDAMYERIRRYTEEQKRLYATVQSRAYKDKRAMLSILRRAAENKVQESLSDAMDDLELESKVPDERPVRARDFPDGAGDIRILQTSSSSWNAREKSSESDNEIHLDPLFHTGTTTDDVEPFADSDEGESSDNSFNQMEMEYKKSRFTNKTKYSSSVPVNVPFMSRPKVDLRERLPEDEVRETVSPDKIAESIQALARSVHDSRDIFGELPPPRKHTMPLTFN